MLVDRERELVAVREHGFERRRHQLLTFPRLLPCLRIVLQWTGTWAYHQGCQVGGSSIARWRVSIRSYEEA